MGSENLDFLGSEMATSETHVHKITILSVFHMALGPNDSLEISIARLRNGIYKLLIIEHRNNALGKNEKESEEKKGNREK